MPYSDQLSQTTFWQKINRVETGKDNGCFRQVDSHLVWLCADFTHQAVLLLSLVCSLLLIKERKAHSAYSPESTEGGIGYNGYKMYKIQKKQKLLRTLDLLQLLHHLLTNLSKIGSLTILPYHLQVKVTLIRNMDIVILKSQLNNHVKVK